MARIVTLTLNPAVDVSTTTEHVEPEHKLRCTQVQRHPGGGGINVARVAHRLGASVLAVYPAGGLSGTVLGQLLDAEGVPHAALPIAGDTRESFHVHENAHARDWRFVLPGPTLAPAEWQACLREALDPCEDLLVLSGSLPPGVPMDFYAQAARAATAAGRRCVLDASGEALAAGLAAPVFLVKPSLRELAELTGHPLPDPASRLQACRALVARGATQWVALSLGAEGAMLVGADQAWFAQALTGPVASTIGAGDSLVGGLVAGIAAGATASDAFRLGMAASAAAVRTRGTALGDAAEAKQLAQEVALLPVQ
ncbi:1-phosphofructokinase family hexose kinase [Ramlibacter sp.]|uniref:1-phosphofructokinase family hexose kinase n=1 Tax=Ramlibacter sp. TaxID=1917967 RepID=UPI0035B0BE5A